MRRDTKNATFSIERHERNNSNGAYKQDRYVKRKISMNINCMRRYAL